MRLIIILFFMWATFVHSQDCHPCDGKMTSITFQLLSPYEEDIRVTQKEKGDLWEVFSGVVQPGDEFTINGVGKFGTLGTEVYIYFDEYLHTTIHTSCSVPFPIVTGKHETLPRDLLSLFE